MYRCPVALAPRLFESPHRRGDVPFRLVTHVRTTLISPQAWGCTDTTPNADVAIPNLPTGVGMYRNGACLHSHAPQSPHRRGDVPASMGAFHDFAGISPQAWGCTVKPHTQSVVGKNLPTGVGMYRHQRRSIQTDRQSPHRRGDVPIWLMLSSSRVRISPQAWGCTGRALQDGRAGTNLPTGVGMYRSYHHQ